MAIKHRVSLLVVSFAIFFQGSSVLGRDTIFTLKNLCSDTIWPGNFVRNNGPGLFGGNSLAPGASNQLPVPPGWSGRIWARTGCSFDASGNGKCTTGDCGGKIMCTELSVQPVTLAEFRIGSGTMDFGSMDFYDVSLVDGYNVGIGIQPSGGTGDCKYAGCVADLNASCPPELQVTNAGSTFACKSACAVFNKPEYCCTGDNSTPATCKPTQYSMVFKKACPGAYSYAYDDETSIFTCSGADYLITFCPSERLKLWLICEV